MWEPKASLKMLYHALSAAEANLLTRLGLYPRARVSEILSAPGRHGMIIYDPTNGMLYQPVQVTV